MRKQTPEFFEKFMKVHPNRRFKNLLDVGSAHINGDIRGKVEDYKIEYAGLDMREGENVDIVLNAHDIPKRFKKGSFDIVTCFDTLEHDDMFWLTVENMKWALKKRGYLLIGVPGGNCPYHAEPEDYWRFTKQAVSSWFEGMEDFLIDVQYDDKRNLVEDAIYAWGRKK
ncbi:MAG: methyltransferase domain-containing protein [Candidatus Hodarchaeota archaeon]